MSDDYSTYLENHAKKLKAATEAATEQAAVNRKQQIDSAQTAENLILSVIEPELGNLAAALTAAGHRSTSSLANQSEVPPGSGQMWKHTCELRSGHSTLQFQADPANSYFRVRHHSSQIVNGLHDATLQFHSTTQQEVKRICFNFLATEHPDPPTPQKTPTGL